MRAQVNAISEKKFNEESTLNSKIDPDNPLKQWLIDYVGQKHNPDNDEVTIEMIIETIAKEFPDFLLAVAEENWIRGYRQAFMDIEVGEDLYKQQLEGSTTEVKNV